MAKAKQENSFWSTLCSAQLYKANQGQRVRQGTAIAIGLVVITGCMRLRGTVLSDSESWIGWLMPGASSGTVGLIAALVHNGIPGLLLLLGLWTAFRVVNWPPFTNFLIDVEHEMEKVSWASWSYLKRATTVVLGTMLVLGLYLFVCDIVWQRLFAAVGFLNLEALGQ